MRAKAKSVGAFLCAYAMLTSQMAAQGSQNCPPQNLFNGVCIMVAPTPATTFTCGPNQYINNNGLCQTDTLDAVQNVVTLDPTYCVASLDDLVFPSLQNADLENFANEGILAYMQDLGILNYKGSGCMDTGISRFRFSQPNDAAAAAFMHIIGTAEKPATSLNNVDRLGLSAWAAQLKNLRVTAAQNAYSEYQKWNFDVCAYVPPLGFKYTPPKTQCSDYENLGSLFGNPRFYAIPPNFGDIGTALAVQGLVTSQGGLRSSTIASAVSTALAPLAGSYAGGLGFALLGEFAPNTASALVRSISPFTYSYAQTLDIDGAAAATSEVVLDTVGRLAGPVGIVASTIADIVFLAIDLVKDANLEKDLQSAITRAQNATINLSYEATTEAGAQELYAIFTSNVNLIPYNESHLPAASQNVDATFTETDAFYNRFTTTAPVIIYKSWDGSPWTASFSLTTKLFNHTAQGTSSSHTANIIKYLDWEGRQLTATYQPASTFFLVTGYPSGISELTDTLRVVTQTGAIVRFTVNDSNTGVPGLPFVGPPGTVIKLSGPSGQLSETTTIFRNGNGLIPVGYYNFIAAGVGFGAFQIIGAYPTSPVPTVQITGIHGAKYSIGVNPNLNVHQVDLATGAASDINPFYFRDAEGNIMSASFK